MSSHAAVSAPLQDCLQRECAILSGYIETIDGLIAVLVEHGSASAIRGETTLPPQECIPVLAMMLQAAGSSSHTLLRLSDKSGLHTRDCYAIARSIVEVAANLCYVMSKGASVAERAMRHARQKAYRDLSRESEIGQSVIRLAFSPPVDPTPVDSLAEDIAEFTSRGDREKGWVDASIDDRIAAVGALNTRAMTALHWARFAVYRHSSEILHGTFFGALFFFGNTSPANRPRSPEGLAASIGQQHMLLLMSGILALSAVVLSFDSAYGFQNAAIRDSSLMDALRDIPYLRSGGDKSDAPAI